MEDDRPCNIDELRAEESHTFDTIDEVLETLSRAIGGRYETGFQN